jgi:hypothetical protein
MTYTRPEINSLGDAAQVIQSLGKVGQNMDGIPPFADPAYDLDE